LGILGSQIKIECVFSLASVLTTLRHYRLQVDNLDQIITVVRNWLDNPRLDYSQHKDLTNVLKVESSLAKYNYDLIKESNYFEQLELDKN
jgi:hypothetical protein